MPRKRKPKELLRLTGAYRADRHDCADAPEGEILAPDWLTGPARDLLPDLAAAIEQAGLSSPYYSAALAMLADAIADFRRYAEIADAEPPIIETTNGNKIQHPAIGLKNQAWKRVMDALKEFGATPSALRNVNPQAKADDDPLAHLLAPRVRSRDRSAS